METMKQQSDRRTSTGARVGALSAMLALAASGCSLYFGTPEEFTEQEREDCLAELQQESNFFPNEGVPLNLGPVVKADNPPPAVSGGTMALSPDEMRIVVSDPDRDMVYVVDLSPMYDPERPGEPELVATVPLQSRDEPGRVAFDDAGRAHIALRRGSDIVSINANDGAILDRRQACASPRGIDFDELTGLLYVACHAGEVVTMDPAQGGVIDSFTIEPGLRDVVVTDDHIYVSKFRTADLYVLDRDGNLLETMRPAGLDAIGFDPFEGTETTSHFAAAVAWRTIPNQNNDGVVMIHQRGRDDTIKPSGGGYGGGFDCVGGVVHAAVTPMKLGVEPNVSAPLASMVLPVDGALINNGQSTVIVAAGNGQDSNNEASFEMVIDIPTSTVHREFDCIFGNPWLFADDSSSTQAIATVAASDNTVVVQMREPAELRIFPQGSRGVPFTIPLSVETVKDTGHQLFHMNTGSSVSCASCHPEGSDDGRVWKFECIGDRRTQPLHFGILGTEPFHWDGDMESFDHLMSEVFVNRMNGGEATTEQGVAMAEWLDTVKAPTRVTPSDSVAVERGRQLFNDPVVGCATCHAGPKLISTGWFDVGTGGKFQVPSLVGIADRKPYMHTGCANSLRERFTNPACGGGDMHGTTSHLSPTELDDLILFMQTL